MVVILTPNFAPTWPVCCVPRQPGPDTSRSPVKSNNCSHLYSRLKGLKGFPKLLKVKNPLFPHRDCGPPLQPLQAAPVSGQSGDTSAAMPASGAEAVKEAEKRWSF